MPAGTLFYFGDSATYWWLAEAIASHKPYQFEEWRIFRMPGYPLLLSPLFFLFGDSPPVMAARIENALIGTLVVAAVGLLSFQIFRNKKMAMLSAVIVAFEPSNIITSVWVLSEPAFSLAMIFQISAFVSLGKAKTHPVFFLSIVGFAMLSAVTVYFRPSWFLFAPFLMMISIVFTHFQRFFSVQKPKNVFFGSIFGSILKDFSLIFVFLIVFCACMAPWWVRNYRVTGRFVPTTLQMGPSLYDGWNPNATGGSDMTFTETFRQLERDEPTPNADGTPSQDTYEYRVDQRMKKAALNWAKAHPDCALQLAGIKFCRLWNVWPNEPDFASTVNKIAVFLTYTPILVFSLLGLWRCRRFGYTCFVLIAPAVYLTMLHLIFVSSLRYRVPALLTMAVLAAFFIVDFFEKNKNFAVKHENT
ncbi:MAG: hypothetical protein FWC50_09585 [Planctomycetaceae bacterium]|nr:hypothetical protein [Planctomycetaceae bacterium]